METKYKITEMVENCRPEFSFIRVYKGDIFLQSFIFYTDNQEEKKKALKDAISYADHHKRGNAKTEKTLLTL